MNAKLSDIEIEFLRESNAIEREFSLRAFEDAVFAWEYAKLHDINFANLLETHRLLLRRLNSRIAGKFRKVGVYVGTQKGIDHEKIRAVLFNWFQRKYKTENDIKKLHIEFEKIHPFEDGNGRTGRIVMNVQRLKIGLPILVIHEGSEQMSYYNWFG